MNRVPLFPLCAVLTAAALLAACGKATNGTCEEANDCTETQDATTLPPQGDDGSSERDATDDVTVSPGDDDDGGLVGVGDATDGNISVSDAAQCPAGHKLCNETCVALDDPTYGCTPTSCTACAVANATPTCTAGACAVGACDPGFGHCTGSAVGCETSLTTTTDCGNCTTSCDAGLLCSESDAGTAACTLTCPANAPTNCSGACADLNTNNQHCGNCTTTCTNPNNGTSSCSNKSCVVTCNSGFHVCGSACYQNTDFPNASGDPCEISEAFGVFVSSSQGTDGSGSGSRTTPYKTIHAGLTAAAAAGKRLYVCAEAYAEADTLVSNVSIFGYFTCAGGTWAVGSGHATVTAPTSPAVTAANVSNVRVESVEWDAPSAGANSSGSSYGMFATGSTLSLVNVTLVAGAGGSGAAGGTGTPPVVAVSCPASDGLAASGSGNNGAAGPAATYSASGYTPSSGTNGAPGPSGDDGTTGGPGPCWTQKATCTQKSETLCIFTLGAKFCGTAGTSGCGGPGGAAGLGGAGGGASIALFGWGASNISVTGGELRSQNGGAGGAGATGPSAPASWANSQGAVGSVSAPYTPAYCDTPDNGCTLIYGTPGTTEPGGTAGGPGGQGGPGGSGAGGSGGDTYSYYRGVGATLSVDATVSLVQGQLGSAGGGPVPGKPGYAGAFNTHD